MKHERLTKAERAKRFAFLKKLITVLTAASIVLFLAVFFTFVPFRLLLPAYSVPAREEGELRLHFLGLAGGVTVVEFPDGEALVVNAGDGSFESDNFLARYLRALDITSLSLLLTNASTKHIGGAPSLYETFRITKTYFPASATEAGAYGRFVSAMEKEGCEQERLARYGRVVNGSGAYAVCLSPYSEEAEDVTADDESAVLYLSYAGVNVLLSGDITAKRECVLLGEYSLDSGIFDSGEYGVRLDETDILLASKHGADSGSSEEWLTLLHPETTVICCNKDETPSGGALERIAGCSGEVLRTDELGVIMITIKDGGYQILPHITE